MRKHSRGAVTVFVTLLLIPAVLVSGTGVDISRVYAARSAARDANQLAANALLTNYDAVLQDLYGLYAVIGDDDDLTGMVDLYVRASLFGEEVTDAQLNQFRLFGGQESVTASVSASEPLSNVEILRRQIEEYSKYRVPVAIVVDILDRLKDSGATEMGANTEAAAQKLEVDDQVEEVVVKFAQVQKKADAMHADFMKNERETYEIINGTVTRLEMQFKDLMKVRQDYEAETNLDKLDDLQDHYDKIKENISFIGATGGFVGKNWVPAHWDEELEDDVPGEWGEYSPLRISSLQSVVDFHKTVPERYYNQLSELAQLCAEADAAKGELERRIGELEAQLNSGNCSAELVTNMKKEIETYKKLLDVDFTGLGQTYQTSAKNYMDNVSTRQFRDLQGYTTVTGRVISYSNLENFSSVPGFEIDFNVNTAFYQGKDNRLQEFQAAGLTYEAPQGLVKFRDASPDHEACCKLLEELDLAVKSEDEELSEEEKQGKSSFKSLFKQMKELWDGLTDYDPAPGAGSYPSSAASGSWAFSTRGEGMELDFGTSDFSVDGGDDKGMRSTLKTFAGLVTGKTDAAELFGNALAKGANRVLLVGYATQMFSNWNYKYTYAEKDAPLSLTGQPISAANNYFYNSEWEYLFNGNLDAGKNLGKATMTILAIRFLANYASSYMVSSVNTEIREMEAVVSAIPFAGGALRFLVRPLYVLGESVVDVSLLRTGHGIALLKTNKSGGWRFSLYNFAVSTIKDEAKEAVDTEKEKQKGLLYSDYLIVFLLVSDPEVLATRIGDLIALNVTTSKNSLPEKAKGNADARADAASSASLFDLSKAYTTFAVETRTEVRFMFLSMPFAQQGINGVVPPTTFPVTVTDYRGY